jgi:hypothetical protein
MDRAKAKTMTTRVQLAAGVFILLAVAAAVAPLGASKADSTDTAAAPPAPAPKPAEAPKIEIDTVMLANAINTVSGPVKNQHIEPDPTTITPPPAAPVLTGVDAWRYLGAIMSSTYKRAIIVVNDQQRLVAEGQTVSLEAAGTPAESHSAANDVQIVEIDKLFVKVKQGEVETKIDIAPRQRAALNVIDPSGRNNGNGGAPGANNQNRPVSSGSRANDAEAAAKMARNMERFKDAKARGDEKAAAMYEPGNFDPGKEGKSEKGEKGGK